jgi:D-glycero-D-manno-heptose 1,7-bisphosphate phosphatase
MGLDTKVLPVDRRTSRGLKPAVFLDRDGVIIENRANYVRRWEDVVVYPQAMAALAALREAGWPVVIVTNQSMVGRGLVPLAAAVAINRRLVEVIAEGGGQIAGVYMCPHAPEEGCRCRKPAPGLLLKAAEELGLDLAGSAMIGDALSDLAAGQEAGAGWMALVRTGRGREQAELIGPEEAGRLRVFDSLEAAVEGWLLDSPAPPSE